ncbi:MAG: patatin-like phospholipase family protein [Thiogranum sp.]|nr:patatin-like phospholipase family protein [Thiogranum sp.]
MISATYSCTTPPRSSYTRQDRRPLLAWPKKRHFRILSLDGGGIKGVFTAQLLADLEAEHLGGQSVANYFDMVVGTSTGGIIALALGTGLTAAEVTDIYLRHGRRIFPRSSFIRSIRSLPGLFLYQYNRGPLMELLENSFAKARLGDSRTRLCIPSFDGHHGEVYVFKTPHHPDYHLDANELCVTVGAATAAAPTFFQPHKANGYRYVDGGVWANNPAMIGVVDALSCFDVAREQVRVLSIGCGRNDKAKLGSWQQWGGLFAWKGIIFSAMDLASQNVLGQTGLLIGRDNLYRVEPNTDADIAMDDYSRSIANLIPDAHASAGAHRDRVAELFFSGPAAPVDMFHGNTDRRFDTRQEWLQPVQSSVWPP